MIKILIFFIVVSCLFAFTPWRKLIDRDQNFSQASYAVLPIAVDESTIQTQNFLEDLQLHPSKATTAEKFLDLLPSDFKKSYVYVYDSQSLQDASFMYPRAIVHGKDARVILTFNGHYQQKGYNKIELMRFDDETSRFALQELDFSNPRRVRFSQKNPLECVACHGTDPRPLWDEYPLWPGVYGSEDDATYRIATYPGVDANNLEVKKYIEFNSTTRQRGRYLKLPDLSLSEPNQYFTTQLFRLNLKRVARQIASNREICEHKDDIQKVIASINVMARYSFSLTDLPNRLRPFMSQAIVSLYQKVSRRAHILKSKRHLGLVGNYMTERFSKGVNFREIENAIRGVGGETGIDEYLVEVFLSLAYQMKIDPNNWSTEFYPKSFNFAAGSERFDHIGEYLSAALIKQCSAKDVTPDLTRSFPPFISCVACHDSGARNIGTHIPFKNPTLFANWLKVGNGVNEEKLLSRIHANLGDDNLMPPLWPMLPSQVVELENYVRQLKGP